MTQHHCHETLRDLFDACKRFIDEINRDPLAVVRRLWPRFDLDPEAEKLGFSNRTRFKLGADHPDTLTSLYNLALSYSQLGRHPEALKLREQALALRTIKLGPDHPDTLTSISSVALSYNALGRHAESLELCEQVAQARERLGLESALNFYNAGCQRAVASAQAQAQGDSCAATAEAVRAMGWLAKSVAAGWKRADIMAEDTDLTQLRGRADFQKLLGSMPGGAASQASAQAK